jgi:predicted transcriptional regulator
MPEHHHDQRLPRGALQCEALEVLCSSGEGTVGQVVDRLSSKLGSDFPYSTVAWTLNQLCTMGLASRSRMPGSKVYFYSARVSHEHLVKAEIVEAVRQVFAGSRTSRLALSYLVDLIDGVHNRLMCDLEDVVEQKRQEQKTKRER